MEKIPRLDNLRIVRIWNGLGDTDYICEVDEDGEVWRRDGGAIWVRRANVMRHPSEHYRAEWVKTGFPDDILDKDIRVDRYLG